MKLDQMSEIEIIDKLFSSNNYSSSIIAGIGDDAAVIDIGKKNYFQLVATDMLIEDVHFKVNKDTNFEKIGRKSLAVNFSDIAAMSGIPEYVLVCLGISKKFSFDILELIYKGINNLACKYKTTVIGGDTVMYNKLIINITVLGKVEKDRVVFRKNSKHDDFVFVTGALGGSDKSKHFDFIPRIDESRTLTSNFSVNSMIDISDGLIYDAYRLAYSSKVVVELELDKIPLSKDAKSIENALYDGEDFELLFTLNEKNSYKLIKSEALKKKINFSCIGRIKKGKPKVLLLDSKGNKKVAEIKGYDHFKS